MLSRVYIETSIVSYDIHKLAAYIRTREENAAAAKRRPQTPTRVSRQRKAS